MNEFESYLAVFLAGKDHEANPKHHVVDHNLNVFNCRWTCNS